MILSAEVNHFVMRKLNELKISCGACQRSMPIKGKTRTGGLVSKVGNATWMGAKTEDMQKIRLVFVGIGRRTARVLKSRVPAVSQKSAEETVMRTTASPSSSGTWWSKRNTWRGRKTSYELSLERTQITKRSTQCTATRCIESNAIQRESKIEGKAKLLANGSRPVIGSVWFAREGGTPRKFHTTRVQKVATSTCVIGAAPVLKDIC